MPQDALTEVRALYLDLLKRSLGDFLYDSDKTEAMKTLKGQVVYVDLNTGQKHRLKSYDELKENGLTGSKKAHTLIGMKRMNQLQGAVETVLREQIPGDLVETGVLRGGACILMRGLLKAYQVEDRQVWAADSFQGFPAADLRALGVEEPEAFNAQAASLETVQENFRRYGLLDEQVHFLPGWFSDTLPQAPIEKIAVLRLDSDLYASTQESLAALYPRVSPGGFVIVDDYYAFQACRDAIREYRQEQGIEDPLVRVDPVCVYWRKSA